MLIKKIFIPIIFFAVTAILFGDDLEFITTKKTMLYNSSLSVMDFNKHAVFEIEKGTRVKYPNKPYIVRTTATNGTVIIIGIFLYKYNEYYINCADLIPVNTNDTFDPSFISDLNSPNRKTWIPSYYIEVIMSQERDTVLSLDPYLEQKYDPYWINDGNRMEWYEYLILFFPCYELVISNSAITFNEDTRFVIKNINKTSNGYIVTVKFAWERWEKYIRDGFNWNNIKEKEYFNMILCVDGDYMDVYIEDMEHKLNTFVQVDQAFLNELKALIEGEGVNLSKITSLPHRAVKQLNVGEECRILENLRLRETPGTAGAVIKTLEQGSKVTILEIGQNENIDGVTAPWVKVKTANEEEGWCFGLYLQETRFDPTPEEMAVKMKSKAENTTVSNDDKAEAPPLPLWAWVAIIGIAVAVSGGVAVFVVLRKK